MEISIHTILTSLKTQQQEGRERRNVASGREMLAVVTVGSMSEGSIYELAKPRAEAVTLASELTRPKPVHMSSKHHQQVYAANTQIALTALGGRQ